MYVFTFFLPSIINLHSESIYIKVYLIFMFHCMFMFCSTNTLMGDIILVWIMPKNSFFLCYVFINVFIFVILSVCLCFCLYFYVKRLVDSMCEVTRELHLVAVRSQTIQYIPNYSGLQQRTTSRIQNSGYWSRSLL